MQYHILEFTYTSDGDPADDVVIDGEIQEAPRISHKCQLVFRDDEGLSPSFTEEDIAVVVEGRCYSVLEERGLLYSDEKIKYIAPVVQPEVIALLNSWGKVVFDGPTCQFNV